MPVFEAVFCLFLGDLLLAALAKVFFLSRAYFKFLCPINLFRFVQCDQFFGKLDDGVERTKIEHLGKIREF